MSGLKDKVVLITGASSGIGKATAVHMAGLGCRLALGMQYIFSKCRREKCSEIIPLSVARREDRLKAVAEECLEAGAQQAEVFVFDVSTVEVSTDKNSNFVDLTFQFSSSFFKGLFFDYRTSHFEIRRSSGCPREQRWSFA